MTGNVHEWTLDRHPSPYSASCSDCAFLAGTYGRVYRGGYWDDDDDASWLSRAAQAKRRLLATTPSACVAPEIPN